MKKSILLGILGVAACAATSYGQGVILMDNYNTGGPNVTFGNGSGGTTGTGLTAGWTAGLYFAVGNISADVTSGNGIPAGSLALATGQGSTATFFTSTGTLGEFLAGNTFVIPGAPAGTTVTCEVIAYLTSAGSYAASSVRGHSAEFTIVDSAATSPTPVAIGTAMPAFSVTPVPEPASLALAGLGGLASLVMLRRKQA